MSSKAGGRSDGYDDVNLEWYELRSQNRKSVDAVIRPRLNDDVLALGIAEFCKSLANPIDAHPHSRTFEGAAAYQEAYPRDFRCLLRACRERPSRRAADNSNEVPPLHAILWSPLRVQP